MIKKIIKNFIIITLVTNSLLCLSFNIYSYIQSQSVLDKATADVINSNKMHTLQFDVQEDIDNSDFIVEQNQLGRIYILSNNMLISIISLMIGLLISLVISIEDSKIIKYILLYVFGNVFFNTILTFIYDNLYNEVFIDGYFIIFKNMFAIYTLLFFIFLCLKKAYAKYRTRQINKFLNKK